MLLQKKNFKVRFSNFRNGETRVDFDKQLHNRQSDFHIYPNSRYIAQSEDSSLLRNIVMMLLAPHSGVESIRVTRYSLHIAHSPVVKSRSIRRLVKQGIAYIG